MVAVLFAGKLLPLELLVPFLKLLVPEPLLLWYFLPLTLVSLKMQAFSF